MSSLLRSARKALRRLLQPGIIRLDGLLICTDPAMVSPDVRKGLFKETYEEPERILVGRFLKPDDRVLEVGGGIGLVSLTCARICGVANVLTYEANPAMEAVIRHNFRLNRLEPNLRIKLVTKDGRAVTFFVNDNIMSSSCFDRNMGTPRTLPSDALDQVLAEWKPTALVMDVEGAEIEMLTASQLPGIRKVILEIHPHIVGEEPTHAMLEHLRGVGLIERERIQKSILLQREG
jgi:FkbM family methyltransferase